MKGQAKAIYSLVMLVCLGLLFYSHVLVPQQQASEIQDFFNQEVNKASDGTFHMDRQPIGVLSVPKIGLRLIIYNNAGESALSHGAGLVPGMSPLGEVGHAVLTAHNGDPTKDLFMKVPKLQKGDSFYIQLKDGPIYQYDIFQTQTVSPVNEFTHYTVSHHDKLVTLRTCVPIGINSDRFLATGKEVGTVDTITEKPRVVLSVVDWGLILICLIAFACLFQSIWQERKVEGLEKTSS